MQWLILLIVIGGIVSFTKAFGLGTTLLLVLGLCSLFVICLYFFMSAPRPNKKQGKADDLFVRDRNGFPISTKTWEELGAPPSTDKLHKATLKEILGPDYIDSDALERANDYIRKKMNIALPRNREKDAQMLSDFLTGKSNMLSGAVFAAKVDGIPTYELAEKYKHDLPMMLRCCEEELKNMAATGNIAAPFYFKRAAILAKKQKNYELEIKVCEILIQACKIYKEAHTKYGNMVLVNRISIDEDMEKRLPTARKNLEKQPAVASKDGIRHLLFVLKSIERQRTATS